MLLLEPGKREKVEVASSLERNQSFNIEIQAGLAR